MDLKPWILAARPKTLSAAVVPVLVGSALAQSVTGHWSPAIAIYALIGALAIQVGTNLFNDVFDFKKGADRADRIGPVRVTQSGLLKPRTVTTAAVLCFTVAFFSGIPLVIHGGWVLVAIGLVSLLLGFAYTGGPYPLAYKGLGDIFVVLFFGIVAVGGVYFLHTGTYDWLALVAGLQVGFLATVLIAINNYRDHNQDRLSNKLTLAVRFGPLFAKCEIALLFLFAYLLLLQWHFIGKELAALLPLLSLPFAIQIARGVWSQEPGPIFNLFLAQSGLVHIIFGLGLSIGLVSS